MLNVIKLPKTVKPNSHQQINTYYNETFVLLERALAKETPDDASATLDAPELLRLTLLLLLRHRCSPLSLTRKVVDTTRLARVLLEFSLLAKAARLAGVLLHAASGVRCAADGRGR